MIGDHVFTKKKLIKGKMKVERLQKLSKDKLIELILSKDQQIKIIEKRLDAMDPAGEIVVNDISYFVILESKEQQ